MTSLYSRSADMVSVNSKTTANGALVRVLETRVKVLSKALTAFVKVYHYCQPP